MNPYSVRSSPDVSYNADRKTGFYVYTSVAYGGRTGWFSVGGTSAGAPQWAALIAIVNQGRALQGLGSLDGATQTLPAIYSLPWSNFNDVTSGYNGYYATRYYDVVTGRGTPIASRLIKDLLTYTGATPLNPTPVKTTGPATTTVKPKLADFVAAASAPLGDSDASAEFGMVLLVNPVSLRAAELTSPYLTPREWMMVRCDVAVMVRALAAPDGGRGGNPELDSEEMPGPTIEWFWPANPTSPPADEVPAARPRFLEPILPVPAPDGHGLDSYLADSFIDEPWIPTAPLPPLPSTPAPTSDARLAALAVVLATSYAVPPAELEARERKRQWPTK